MYGNLVNDRQQGFLTPEAIPVSNLHGGLVPAVHGLVVLGVSVLVFRRRDIT